MEYAALLRSILKHDENSSIIDIKRIYVYEKGNPIDYVLIETIIHPKNIDDF